MKLTKREAQALAVIASRLDRRPTRRKVTREDIFETFEHLGTIQLDTISVISRSHQTVLWSRLGAYDPDLIIGLYEDDHSLSEYIAHAASILPTTLLPLFRPMMERRRESPHYQLDGADPQHSQIAQSVLARIAAQGPMASRHFDAPDGATRPKEWDWWGNKPERQILDVLWVRGDLMIHKRDSGFARHFDLHERVTPGFWDGESIPFEQSQRELLIHAIRALGVTTARWASDYFRTGGPSHVPIAETRKLMQAFEAEDLVIPVEIAGIDEPAWMDPGLQERLELLRERKGWPTLTTFLSPFDNLTWTRLRGEQLWDFEYRLECYVPAPKRRYGYYSLPILHRGDIVGRLDPSFNRKTGVLTIKALHVEPGVRPGDSLAKALCRAIEDLLGFLGGQPGAWILGPDVSPQVIDLLRPHAGLILQAAD